MYSRLVRTAVFRQQCHTFDKDLNIELDFECNHCVDIYLQNHEVGIPKLNYKNHVFRMHSFGNRRDPEPNIKCVAITDNICYTGL